MIEHSELKNVRYHIFCNRHKLFAPNVRNTWRITRSNKCELLLKNCTNNPHTFSKITRTNFYRLYYFKDNKAIGENRDEFYVYYNNRESKHGVENIVYYLIEGIVEKLQHEIQNGDDIVYNADLKDILEFISENSTPKVTIEVIELIL
ncbi:hypothetical protein ['Paenibacillus yunnanensis' Narsing Rao et al. 2020]|uniref:hypothetical protein n=1 Tax=Paenibacillus tengchongensis TaxID=2608684 RepID=UPI001652187B|nr:hypothetical protein [Paenibacillus tengchongensis]